MPPTSNPVVVYPASGDPDATRPIVATGAAPVAVLPLNPSDNSPLDAAWHVAAAGSGVAAEFDRMDAQPRANAVRRELFVATREATNSRTVSGKVWVEVCVCVLRCEDVNTDRTFHSAYWSSEKHQPVC